MPFTACSITLAEFLAFFSRKVWRFCALGVRVHMHVTGSTLKGLVLSYIAQGISLLFGRRVMLTFHAGVDQQFTQHDRRHKARLGDRQRFHHPACRLRLGLVVPDQEAYEDVRVERDHESRLTAPAAMASSMSSRERAGPS